MGWAESSCAASETSSAPCLDATKAMVWASWSVSLARSSAVSARSDEAGCHNTAVRLPLGELSRSNTATSSAPMSRPANSPALGAVAEDSATTGSAPYCAASRRRRRITWATWAPKTPW